MGRLCQGRFATNPQLLFLVCYSNIITIMFGHSVIFHLAPILQWEYQVGPSVGIEAGDHIWCSRYILEVNLLCSLFILCDT